jgi:predicted RNase H-like nuclease
MTDFLPVYNFPETKFVKENSVLKQIFHILSEVREVEEVLLQDEKEFNFETMVELADLTHSLETLWRIMELRKGREYVHALFKNVQIKNLARGYYDL